MGFHYISHTGLALFLSSLSAGIARHAPSLLPVFTDEYEEEMHGNSFSGVN